MSFVYVADGIDDVLAAHLNQYADAWSGVAGKGQPFNAVAVNDPINFAISARNLDPTNSRAAQFLKADGTVLFQCDASGVKVSPDGTVAGVPVTVTSTQTLTNKTFSGAITQTNATAGAVDNLILRAGGNLVTDESSILFANLSGSATSRIWGDATAAVLRIKAGGAFAIHTGAADFNTTNLAFYAQGGAAPALGFYGHATATQTAVGAAATDLATVITLANNLRTALQANGMVG